MAQEQGRSGAWGSWLVEGINKIASGWPKMAQEWGRGGVWDNWLGAGT